MRAFATVTPDIARAQAAEMDALTRDCITRGPLHGIPYGLKDLFDTAGVTTGWGAEPYADRVPATDAAIPQRLRAAGAVLLGKTTLGALAYGDLWYGGRTRNPWNPEEGSSGSSAGSASATAAGLCAFAIGTETLGSITSPSQRCGTTGLRPTFGRVSRAGAMPLCWSLDKVGPIARSVADCGTVLSVLNGADPADRGSIAAPFHWNATRPLDGLRLGHVAEAFEAGSDGERAALEVARTLGLETVPVALPPLPYGALLDILYAEAAAAFEELTLSGRDDALTWQDADAWPNAFRRARFLSAVDLVQLDRLRTRVMEAVAGLFDDADVLIGPFGGDMLVATNFTGHPCLHLRAGFETARDAPARIAGEPVSGRHGIRRRAAPRPLRHLALGPALRRGADAHGRTRAGGRPRRRRRAAGSLTRGGARALTSRRVRPRCYRNDITGGSMGQLIVRNLEEDVVTALKSRAAAHNRSAEAEHRAILRDVLCAAPATPGDWFDRARALRARLRVAHGTTTDILRADRDRDDALG